MVFRIQLLANWLLRKIGNLFLFSMAFSFEGNKKILFALFANLDCFFLFFLHNVNGCSNKLHIGYVRRWMLSYKCFCIYLASSTGEWIVRIFSHFFGMHFHFPILWPPMRKMRLSWVITSDMKFVCRYSADIVDHEKGVNLTSDDRWATQLFWLEIQK